MITVTKAIFLIIITKLYFNVSRAVIYGGKIILVGSMILLLLTDKGVLAY